jgi:ABC-2 type transport system permease protein
MATAAARKTETRREGAQRVAVARDVHADVPRRPRSAMSSIATTFAIARREFRGYFDSPIAYVVICLSLFMVGAVFFFRGQGGFWQLGRATLEGLFQWIPRGLSWLVIPVITMRLVAEEKRSGTLELLITLPVKDAEVILGKFFGAWGLVLVLIAATGLYPIMMFAGVPWNLGALDSGPIASGYLGLMLYSGAAVALGLFVSSLTESQIVAFFVTFVVLLFLHLLGSELTVDILPGSFDRAIMLISFDSRLADFSRGMINTADVLYFLSITVVCLLGAFWALERRKWV